MPEDWGPSCSAPAPAPPPTPGDGDDRARLAALVARRFGIVLRDRHAASVCEALRSRAGEEGLAAYLDRLAAVEGGDELAFLVGQVATNVTAFFREPHHFEILRGHVRRDLVADAPRFWSAGCATGEEAWSLAASVAPLLTPERRARMLVLATDIDRDALAAARRGRYAVDPWTQLCAAAPGQFRIVDDRIEPVADLRPLVRVRELNLVDPFPFQARFDAIFCRNTLIYFAHETRDEVLARLVARLRHGGLLMLGHSETLLSPLRGLEPAGQTAYRRVA